MATRVEVVKSSNIHSIGYKSLRKELMVLFHSGKAYIYRNVMPEVWSDFLDASSKGQFLAANIRETYDYYQMDEAGQDAVAVFRGQSRSDDTQVMQNLLDRLRKSLRPQARILRV